jgi:adenosylmethionine-8-amino-7-oxononanoate aminotransferase
MALSKDRKLGEIVALRVKTKTNKALNADLTAAIQGAFAKHGIIVDPSMHTDLIVALPDEIERQLSDVVLPGGTNC